MLLFNTESSVEKEHLEYKYDVPNVIKTFPWDTKFHASIPRIS